MESKASKKPIRLAIMGFGNAAKALTKILIEKKETLEASGLYFEYTAISTGSKGNLIAAQNGSLAMGEILDCLETHGKFTASPHYTQRDTLNLIQTADYDVMVELTPLNIMTGQPAIHHIETALRRGKHVITANKGPIAWAYQSLKELAKLQGVQFLYETTVMDGTPIFNLKNACLPFCQVKKIKGILNTTTNFVLEHLAKGETLENVMAEGRRRGFVEADPSLDLEGWDSAAKLTALMNVLMDANLKPTAVERKGIEDIKEDDIRAAAARGETIKLLCEGFMGLEGPVAKVYPVHIPMSDLYSTIDETSSVISIETDLMGEISIIEHHPEIEQTGFGIFSDLITLSHNMR